MPDSPILEFTSHIAGKNAIVRVYSDRIEWERKGMGGALRHGMAVATIGLSYAATGVSQKRETEVIPMRSVSSVKTKKGMMNTLVTIITTGNSIEMNVSHKEAKQVSDTVNGIIARG